ncbi:MAG: hypothetical protein P8O91_01260 [Luminiphilus sp.]|nr:hypothetical protein [Luminiphilus sp.]
MESFVVTDILFLSGVILILAAGIARYTRASKDEPDPKYQHFGPPTKKSHSIKSGERAVFEPADPADEGALWSAYSPVGRTDRKRRHR